MRMLFANFSGGRPGAGLLVLRAALGLAVWSNARALWADLPSIPGWMLSIPLLLILLLLAGLLTRFSAIACATVQSAVMVFVASVQPAQGIVAMLLAIALFLLGPGAYSFDAWLFGRRIVELPKPRRIDEDDYPNG